MIPGLLLPFLWLAAPQEGPEPRLWLTDLEGKESVRRLEQAVTDPRQLGAWVLRPEGFPAPESGLDPGRRVRVRLVDGDELWGRVRGGSGETLHFELVGRLLVPIDIERIVSLEFPALVPERNRGSLEAAEEGDRLYRQTAGADAAGALDAIDGTFESFDEEGVRFDSVLGSRVFPWEEVAGLWVESLDGQGGPGPADPATGRPGVPVVLDLVDGGLDAGGQELHGSRVHASLEALEGQECRVVLAGAHIALPLGAVAAITVDDGRLTYLSDLTPGEERGRGTPFDDELGMSWPHRMDEAVTGGPLRSGGRLFRRGIGMHAPASLSFPLPAGSQSLHGRVGIDDSTRVHSAEARGAVIFRVRQGERVLWESPVVRGGEAPVTLPPVALDAAQPLVLECDPDGDFAGDRADWLELVLVAPAPPR